MNQDILDHARNVLQKIWGYQDFREAQADIIRSLLMQQDALIIMPTGGGKSICFQLPALLQPGLTLVVSPLVALMENQVQELRDRNISAALLHSELPTYQRRQILQQLERQQLRLLYLSPETLLSKPVWEKLSLAQLKISSLILDEAHCLVQWGDTFRPAYRRLGTVRSALLKSKPADTKISIAAFTATADPDAQKTIQQVLQLQQPAVFRQNPYRQNLYLKVQTIWTPRGRKQQVLDFIQKNPQTSGLIYVRTRRDSESLAQWLKAFNYTTAAYHAGLSPQERREIEANWLSDKMLFVVCTSAFGMGINKSNVRWVIHFHAPSLLSEYVQEIGRAGRDGKLSVALTLVSEPTGWLDPEDKHRQEFFSSSLRSQYTKAQKLVHKLPVRGEISAVVRQFPDAAIALALLHSSGQLEWVGPFNYIIDQTKRSQPLPQLNSGSQQMKAYLVTRKCRWQFLLTAFGFKTNFRCGHCDRCT